MCLSQGHNTVTPVRLEPKMLTDNYMAYMRFCEESLDVFKVTERSQFCDRQINRQMPWMCVCMHACMFILDFVISTPH